MLEAASDIVYVRASYRPIKEDVGAAGGLLPYLHERIAFRELLVPHFYRARPFWEKRPESLPLPTNSGALGKIVAGLPGAVLSTHPTHAFAGVGERVGAALRRHDASSPCFDPIGRLADEPDFSMLLLGCLEESPGFSTVHVAQQRLGLTRRHLLRFLLRWDVDAGGRVAPRRAWESPGCSMSFGKFYPLYEADGNLVRGAWGSATWIWIPSARKALEAELRVLADDGRFVECGRWNCTTCRLRLY